LAAQEPDRADHQVDLTVPLIRLGMLEGRDGIPKVERAIEILENLQAGGRLTKSDELWLKSSRRILEKLLSSKESVGKSE
jgi:hypothetical protein